MINATFSYMDKVYTLNEENCSGFYNDETEPIQGIEFEDIINLLAEKEIAAEMEYFDQGCDKCRFERPVDMKVFPFLEFQFYLFAKDKAYVMSSLSKEYEGTTLEQLEKMGKVNLTYIVNIIVCSHCNDFTIEIECFNE